MPHGRRATMRARHRPIPSLSRCRPTCRAGRRSSAIASSRRTAIRSRIDGVFGRRREPARRKPTRATRCRPDLAGPDRRLSRAVRRRRRRVLRCWIGRRRAARRAIVGALHIGLVSAVASLGLQGLDLLDLPLSGLFSFAPWKSALGTSARAVAADCDRCDVDCAPGLAKPVDVDVLEADRRRHGGRRPLAVHQQPRRHRSRRNG